MASTSTETDQTTPILLVDPEDKSSDLNASLKPPESEAPTDTNSPTSPPHENLLPPLATTDVDVTAEQVISLETSDSPFSNPDEADCVCASTETAARCANCWLRLERLIGNLEDRVQNAGGGAKSIGHGQGQERLSPTKCENKDPLEPPKPQTKTVPSIRHCNFTQFVNQFASEDTHAIEVLVTGSRLVKEIYDEWEERCRLGVEGYSEKDDNKKPSSRRYGANSTETWIHGVRIQSPKLMEIFEKVTDYQWGTKPHTFLRPFRYFIHFHNKLKAKLEWMEEHIKNPESREGTEADSDPKGTEEEEDVFRSESALEEFRCYIKFAETEIVPSYYAFEDAHFAASRKIRYQDLWYLFRPGELIYIPQNTLVNLYQTGGVLDQAANNSSAKGHGATTLQKVWRLIYTQPTHGCEYLMEEFDDSDYFRASCYYLDYDGSAYAGVIYTFNIRYFKDKRDIRELPFYPIRFAEDWESCLAEGQHWGAKFTEYIDTKHLWYTGWSVTTHPVGSQIEQAVRKPEHIEGDVIIDFQETFNNCPEWKRNFADVEPMASRGGYYATVAGNDAIITWSDVNRTKKVSYFTEAVVDDDNIDTIEHDIFLAKSCFLTRKSRALKPKPTGDDLALLPRRLFSYAIRDRMFVPINVYDLTPIERQADVFDKLELRPEHKRHVEALIRTHFRKNELDAHGELRTQDLIRGKGKGVVFLLHGPPGVGKTATAEAIAQKFNKPLFPITCGDLGFSPRDVEEKLTEVFRLAHLWDCVLLLDEADVFLSARNANDVKRNGLVSVFLRVLEYYNGVLFLTTNRVGKLDAAVTSRIHLILHYKRLKGPEILNIFKLNIERLEQIEQQRHEMFKEPKLFILKEEILRFAEEHYLESERSRSRERWNGRQIRNAFLIATSLARYEMEKQGPGFQPQLRASHFQEVEMMTREFDSFRRRLNMGDDAQAARRRGERDDSWDEAEDLDDNPVAPPLSHSRSYQSPLGSRAGGNLHAGYQPSPRGLSPHSTPTRVPFSGTSHPTPAHMASEYTHGGYPMTPPLRSQDSYQRSPRDSHFGLYSGAPPSSSHREYNNPPMEKQTAMPIIDPPELHSRDIPVFSTPDRTPPGG